MLSIVVLALLASTPSKVVGPHLSVAKHLCTSGANEEAIEAYRLIAENAADVESSDAKRLMEACMAKLVRLERGRERLQAIADKPAYPIVSARALLVLATDYYWGKAEKDCSEAFPIYRRIEIEHPTTDEAYRATISKVTNCLIPAGLDHDAVQELQRVVREARGSNHAAEALYQLGVLYRWREERGKARDTLLRLINEYPGDLEYPFRGGINIVERARLELRALDEYELSPLLDRVTLTIERMLGLDRPSTSRKNPWDDSGVEPIVAFVARLASISFVCCLLALTKLTGRLRRTPDPGEDLFSKPWSLAPLILLLTVVATSLSWGQALWERVGEYNILKDRFTWTGAGGEVLQNYLTLGVMLIASLWRQSLGRVFSIRMNALRRVVAWIFSAFAIQVAVALVVFWFSQTGFALDRFPFGRGTEIYSRGAEAGSIAMALSISCFGPIAEELVFRGLLFEAFRRHSNDVIASILSSLLFAMMHLEPLLSTIMGFVFGMIAVYVRCRFRSMAPNTLLHMLVNIPRAIVTAL